jgi:putative ABC transport system substrate-binding protein
MAKNLGRREFVGLLGGAAASRPFVAIAQPQSMPVVGLLRSTTSGPFAELVTALRKGLHDSGFDDGRNVAIEQRWANFHLDALPGLAAELVQRNAKVIVGNQAAILVAHKVSSPTPGVFVSGEDPVAAGLVTSLSRPGGNITGVTFFAGSQLNSKRMELLHELLPQAKVVAVLGDPTYLGFEPELPKVEAAAKSFGWRLVVERASSEREFAPAFDKFTEAKADALLVSGSPLFTGMRDIVVRLAAQHRLPAVYDLRNLVVAGGLMSYSSSINGAYRQAGEYAGRILKGAKPAELPVLQAATFQLSINLKTAKALGITVSPALLARADEVIE